MANLPEITIKGTKYAIKDTPARSSAGSRDIEYAFEFGTYQDSDGVTRNTNAKRIRCQNMIKLEDLSCIIVPEGYLAWVFVLDRDFAKLGAYKDNWQTGSVYARSVIADFPSAAYINLAFKNTDNADMTNTDMTAIKEGFVVSRISTSPIFANLFGGVDDVFYAVSFEAGDTIIMIVDNPVDSDQEIGLYDANYNRLETWYFRSNSYTRTAQVQHNGIRYVKIPLNSPLAKRYGRSFQVALGERPGVGAVYRELLPDSALQYKLNRFDENATPYRKGNINGSWYNRFVLFHIADLHVSTGSQLSRDKARALIAAASVIKPDAVVDSGDLSVGGVGQTQQKTYNDFDAYGAIITKTLPATTPLMVTVGNHDSNDNPHNFPNDFVEMATTKQGQWSHIWQPVATKYSNIVWGDSPHYKGYHFLDIAKSGYTLRVIVLDGLDHADYSSGSVSYDGFRNEVYSQDQINWLCDILSEKTASRPYGIDENYGIVICNHFPFAPYRANGYSDIYPALNDGMFTQGWTMIPEIVKAWKDRTSISKTFPDATQEDTGLVLPALNPITVNVDFSNVPASALFVTFLCGHTHSKNMYIVRQEGGVNFGLMMLVEDSGRYQGEALSRVLKTDYGYENTAGSQIAIDMNTRKLYRTAYGAYMRCDETDTPVTEIYDF